MALFDFNNKGNKKPSPSKGPKFGFNLMWMYVIIAAFLLSVYYFDNNTLEKKLDTIDQFEDLVKTGGVEKITIYRNNKEAEAQLSKSATQQVFSAQELQAAPDAEGKVEVKFGDTQSFEKKIETWKQEGWFKGSVS